MIFVSTVDFTTTKKITCIERPVLESVFVVSVIACWYKLQIMFDKSCKQEASN